MTIYVAYRDAFKLVSTIACLAVAAHSVDGLPSQWPAQQVHWQ